MKKKNKNKNGSEVSESIGKREIISLNDKLINNFDIEELESRLETDPLMFSQLFGLTTSDGGDGDIEPLCACKKLENCPELKCVCRGAYNEPDIEVCNPICENVVEL